MNEEIASYMTDRQQPTYPARRPMNHYEYKGYIGSAEVDVRSGVLVGNLVFIRDTITYSAETPAQLEKAFREAVDDYLATCEQLGDEPDRQQPTYPVPGAKFRVDDEVEKHSGEYTGPGTVVGVFAKDGGVRYAVAHKIEGGTGRFIHIYTESNIRHRETRE